MSLRENPKVVCGYCQTVLDSREEYLDHRREEHLKEHGGGRRQVSNEDIVRIRQEQRRQDKVAALARQSIRRAVDGDIRNAVRETASTRGERNREVVEKATDRVSDALMILNGADVEVRGEL